jgi:hypothetical protein
LIVSERKEKEICFFFDGVGKRFDDGETRVFLGDGNDDEEGSWISI